MADSRSPWRALRPAFLAGAATLTWLTFSASGASADTFTDATSLLGGVTSSISSVTDKLPVSAAVASEAAPESSAQAQVSTPDLFEPLVGDFSERADHVGSSLPLVTHVVPAGPVSVLADPIAQFADAATAEVVNVAVPPVAEALPVLDPVLQPVGDVVTGDVVLPLPAPLEKAPVVVPAEAVTAAMEAAVAAEPAATAAMNVVSGLAAIAESRVSGTAVILAELPEPRPAAPVAPDFAEEQSGTVEPSPAPAQVPSAPVSGTGSSVSSAASSGAAAWLNHFTFNPPMTGSVSAGETSEHATAPVSFDPGSSPD